MTEVTEATDRGFSRVLRMKRSLELANARKERLKNALAAVKGSDNPEWTAKMVQAAKRNAMSQDAVVRRQIARIHENIVEKVINEDVASLEEAVDALLRAKIDEALFGDEDEDEDEEDLDEGKTEYTVVGLDKDGGATTIARNNSSRKSAMKLARSAGPADDWKVMTTNGKGKTTIRGTNSKLVTRLAKEEVESIDELTGKGSLGRIAKHYAKVSDNARTAAYKAKKDPVSRAEANAVADHADASASRAVSLKSLATAMKNRRKAEIKKGMYQVHVDHFKNTTQYFKHNQKRLAKGE